MEKSIDDKLFFISKLDFDVIVDFGCANGVFLSKLKGIKPNVKKYPHRIVLFMKRILYLILYKNRLKKILMLK